jgi:hypothetical protein
MKISKQQSSFPRHNAMATLEHNDILATLSKYTKNEDSTKLGTDFEHQKAKGYSTQRHDNLSNSSTLTKQTFLQGFAPKGSTDYSLWKVTKTIKQITKSSPPRGTWARNNAEKAHALAKHLEQVFQLHPLENTPEEDVIQLVETPYQLGPSMKRLKELKFKKSSTA